MLKNILILSFANYFLKKSIHWRIVKYIWSSKNYKICIYFLFTKLFLYFYFQPPKVHAWMMLELHRVVYFGKNHQNLHWRTNTTAISYLQVQFFFRTFYYYIPSCFFSNLRDDEEKIIPRENIMIAWNSIKKLFYSLMSQRRGFGLNLIMQWRKRNKFPAPFLYNKWNYDFFFCLDCNRSGGSRKSYRYSQRWRFASICIIGRYLKKINSIILKYNNYHSYHEHKNICNEIFLNWRNSI